MTGQITSIIPKNEETKKGGYFFIRDEQGHDRFAHNRDLIGVSLDDVRSGDKVEFEPIDGPPLKGNGRRAECIKVIR